MLVLAASMALAQQKKSAQQQGAPERRGPGRGAFPFFGGAALLGIPEVQKELVISDEQKGLIEDMQADLRQQMFSGANFNREEFEKLSEDERRKRMEEFRKKGEEISKKATEMIAMILEAKQVERLAQLRLQSEGVAALARADVAQKVGLSDEQRQKIEKTQKDLEDLWRSMRNASQEERQQAFSNMREQREKANGDILAMLSPAQKDSWDKIQGKKFEFPQPRGFGGRPAGDGARPNGAPKKVGE